MRKTKEITMKLQYYPSKVDRKNGIYMGGVASPKFLNELAIDVCDDYDYDIENDEFIKNGLLSIEISGTNRALKEFGKFLVNIATFNTKDEDYHEHIDNINDSDGKPYVNLTVKKQTRQIPERNTE